MELNKRKKGVLLGSFWGITSQLVMTVLTFITRSIFLHYFSIELLGYNTLFADIMWILNVAELGLGTSVTLALHQPVADKDYYKISAIIQLLNRIYRIIGLAVLGIGGILVICLPIIVRDPVENIGNLRLAFSLYVINEFLLFYFLPYKNFLGVLQQWYVVERVNTIGHLLSAALKILVLVITHNYVLYLLLQFTGTLLSNLYYRPYIRKHAPYLFELRDARLRPEEAGTLLSNSWKMIYYRVSTMVVNNTDNLITSIFLGITIVGYFSNYKNIVNIVASLIQRILVPISNAMGSFATENGSEQTMQMLNRLTFFCFASSGLCCACLTGLIDPFITVWLGTDYLYSLTPSMIVFFNMYLSLTLQPLSDVFNISKCYIHHRYIPICEILINLILSLIFVNYIGLTGIFLGTTVCHLTSLVLKSRAIFRDYFHCTTRYYFQRSALYALLIAGIIVGTYQITQIIPYENAWIALLINLPISIVIPLTIICLLFWKTDEFQYFWKFVTTFLGE